MAAYLDGFLTRRVRKVTGTILAALAVTICAPLAASVPCFVTNLTDSSDPGTPGELRYCVDNGAGNIAFSSSLNGGTITVLRTLEINQSTTITGPGANLLTISGGNAVQIFDIKPGTVAVSGLTIANGKAGPGGGIYNSGTLTVSNCTFSGNTAGAGGGIYNTSTLMLSNSTFSGNTASDYGGGIYDAGMSSVTNSTFTGNTAGTYGGGIYNSGTLAASNSTFPGNTASYGGGIYNAGTLTLSNDIVAGNTSTSEAGDDCDGCGTPSYNLISTPGAIVNPQLSTLGWYGGSTQTMIPLQGSPAIGAGMASATDDPNIDQRNFGRPTTGEVDEGAVQTNYLIVATTADTSDASPACDANGDSPCSLRDALTVANTDGSADIAFASGVAGTINLSNALGALPSITGNLDLVGPQANVLTVSGGGSSNVGSVFTVSSANAAISGITIANGNSFNGGGIAEETGTLIVTNSAFSGNMASNFGGGILILNDNCTLIVNDSTFSGNTASNFGGGILNGNGTLIVTNSTFFGNTASEGGGIVINGGTLTMNNSTFSANTAANAGGGIFNNGGTVMLSNSIVAGNTTTNDAGDDCDGCGTPSYNLISTPSAIVNPLLAPLGLYGGSTQTMLPLPGSPAICAGSVSLDPAGLGTDQRGFARLNLASNCLDLGADQTNYLIVITTADTSDPSSGCNSTGTGTPCSLRDALTLAASNGSADIAFASGVAGTINLSTVNTPLPAISGNLDLFGPGANNLTVSGGNSSSVGTIFEVASTNAAISGITIANGINASSSNGGGIENVGMLTVSDCTFSGNTANDGGGIFTQGGTLTVSNSTFSGNTGPYGGGIFNSGSTLTVNNSTFSGNIVSLWGGGILNDGGTSTVNNSTISGNTASYTGGGILNYKGTLTLSNSIVAGNTTTYTPGDDCDSCGTQSTSNLINTPSTSPAINPALAPLGSYGGPNQTMLPLPGSPAICAGSAPLDPAGLGTDQRGFPRLNTTYAGYSASTPCLDLGADQTNYQSVQFGSLSGYSGTAGYAVSTPAAPLVSVTENGQNTGAVPVTLNFTGGPTPTTVTGAGPVTTVAGSGAQFPALTVRPAGDYTLGASLTIVGSVAISANVPLDIAPQVPATVTIKGISTESTTLDTAFPTLLAVTVTDANGMVIPNYSGVTFTATTGANGQSGKFANGTDTVTKNTNSNGVATASTFTANNDVGSYKVGVTAGTAHATFTLTNVAGASLSASSLHFSTVPVGETSAAQTVTLTNRERVALTFTSIQASAGFGIASNTCGTGIGVAPAACTIGVTFAPTATGDVTGTLTFTDNAGNSPQVVSLTGSGELPVALSTSILRFGSVPVHTTSGTQTVTLTNHQNVRLTFTNIQVSAGFRIASNTCSPAIGASPHTCTIGVTFSPTVHGGATGTLTFTDSAGTSPQVVNLSGYGQ